MYMFLGLSAYVYIEGSGKAQGTMSSEGGSHSLGCAGCGEESRTWVWATKCGAWTTKRDKFPCGLIDLAWGVVVVERK
jgi:hypothetical protein